MKWIKPGDLRIASLPFLVSMAEADCNIQAALRRIEDRTFAPCTHCEETIARKSLSDCPLDTLLYSLPGGRRLRRYEDDGTSYKLDVHVA
jgi:hypothetical protein